MEGINLKGDDISQFRSQNRWGKRWPYLEPHKMCGIDVLSYNFVAKRGVLQYLALSLDSNCSPESFEILAVRPKFEKSIFLTHWKNGSSHPTSPVRSHSAHRRSSRSRARRAAVGYTSNSNHNSILTPLVTELTEEELGHYFGARFEALCTGQTLDNPRSRFFTISELNIGDHKVCLTAETDCRLPGKKISQSKYGELKCRIVDKKKARFHAKYKKYWLQCVLAGIPKIIEGVRDNDGTLLNVNQVQAESLPEICLKNKARWDKHKILGCLEYLLDKISEVCTENLGITVRIRFESEEKRVFAELLPNNQFSSLISRAILQIKKSDTVNGNSPPINPVLPRVGSEYFPSLEITPAPRSSPYNQDGTSRSSSQNRSGEDETELPYGSNPWQFLHAETDMSQPGIRTAVRSSAYYQTGTNRTSSENQSDPREIGYPNGSRRPEISVHSNRGRDLWSIYRSWFIAAWDWVVWNNDSVSEYPQPIVVLSTSSGASRLGEIDYPNESRRARSYVRSNHGHDLWSIYRSWLDAARDWVVWGNDSFSEHPQPIVELSTSSVASRLNAIEYPNESHRAISSVPSNRGRDLWSIYRSWFIAVWDWLVRSNESFPEHPHLIAEARTSFGAREVRGLWRRCVSWFVRFKNWIWPFGN